MSDEILREWAALANDQQKVGARLWTATQGWQGLNTDPRLFSCQLYHRLWAHTRAFNVLFSNKLNDDAEIIVRSAIEVAICFASLKAKPAEFVTAIREDAAFTTEGQIPLWTRADAELGAEAAATIALVFGPPANGKKYQKLDFPALAKGAGVAKLHDWHKHLSATAVHVTGLSIMKSVEAAGQSEWTATRKGFSIGMSCAAFQLGMTVHAEMIEANEISDELMILAERFEKLPSPDEPSE